MKTSKLLFLLMVIGMIAVSLTACKKDDPAPGLTGFWTGKYGNGNAYPTSGYAFLLRKDGTIRVFNDSDTTKASVTPAEGIYSFLGSTLTAKYTYLGAGGTTFSVSAQVNDQFTFMEGTWGPGDNTSGNGRYFLVKQP